MVAVTMVLSFAYCLRSAHSSWPRQTGLGAMLLIANFAIAKNTGDYFALPADSNPLLHTWSLSVEEQFYMMFPAVVVFGWALSRRWRRIRRGRGTPWTAVLVGAAALASMWLAMIGAWALGPLLAPFAKYLVGFYSPFTRAWEFAAGALLAVATTRRLLRSARHAQILAWLGVALLAGSAWLINNTTPFPGPWTLLPVGATLLLIAAGTHHSTWVNRALGLPAMVKIGDWSYSIYLWHWPLRVFAVRLWPEAPYAAVLAAALSLLPAVASYRWVEQPIRRLPPLTPRRTFALVGSVVCPSILLAAALGVAADHYWYPRYLSGAVPIAHHGDTGLGRLRRALTKTSTIRVRTKPFGIANWKWQGKYTRCFQSKPGSRIDVALVGDSHAGALLPRFRRGAT